MSGLLNFYPIGRAENGGSSSSSGCSSSNGSSRSATCDESIVGESSSDSSEISEEDQVLGHCFGACVGCGSSSSSRPAGPKLARQWLCRLSRSASSAGDCVGFGPLGVGHLAQPQIANGVKLWPEFWGLTHSQVQELLIRLRQDPVWASSNDVHALVRDFVVPWTRGTGLGYALLLNKANPQEVNVMISHSFCENAEEFLEAVLRSTGQLDVVYICALANYQAEDGVGPSISQQLGEQPDESPFWRVLAHIAARGFEAGWRWRLRPCLIRVPTFMSLLLMVLVCLPVLWRCEQFQQWWINDVPLSSAALAWDWVILCSPICVISLLSSAMLQTPCIYRGRMIVIPNRKDDIYTRLWCVYEIFVARRLLVDINVAPTLADAGSVSSRFAKCTNIDDETRIRAEVELFPGGYSGIDHAVKRTLHGVRRHVIGLWLKYTILQVFPTVTFCLSFSQHARWWPVVMILVFFYTIMVATLYLLARRTKGVISVRMALVSSCALIITLGAVLREIVLLYCQFRSERLMRFRYGWMQVFEFVLYEVTAVAVTPLLATRRPLHKIINSSYRWCVLVLMAASLFISGTLNDSILYRGTWQEVLTVGTLLAWARTAPIYMVWTEALHFGMVVEREGDSTALLDGLCWSAVILWAWTAFEIPSLTFGLLGFKPIWGASDPI